MTRDKHDEHDDEEDDKQRQTRGLMAFAVVLLLGLAASYLVRELRKEGLVEDCLLAQRTNCDALIDQR